MQSTQCQPIRPADLTPKLITEHHPHHHHYRVFTIINSTIYTVPSEPLRLTHFGMTLSGEKEKKRRKRKRKNLSQWILPPSHGLPTVFEFATCQRLLSDWVGFPSSRPSIMCNGPRTTTTILWSAVIIIFYCLYIPPRHRQEECMNAPGRKPNRSSRRLQLSYEAGRRGKGTERNSSVDSLQIHCTTPLDKMNLDSWLVSRRDSWALSAYLPCWLHLPLCWMVDAPASIQLYTVSATYLSSYHR